MSRYQQLVRARDAILHAMGWTPRRFDVPNSPETSARELGDMLESRSHEALVRRIKGQ